jgi:hypothetical protein
MAMKKIILLILLLVLMIVKINCGGGGGDSTPSSSGTTTVEIMVGETRKTSQQTEPIPSNVTSLRITVTAADMETIQKEVSAVAGSTVIVSLEVPNGLNRRFLVEAVDRAGNVLYRGDRTVNLDGRLLTLAMQMESTAPPVPPVPPATVDLSITNVIISPTSSTFSFDVNNSGNTAANNVVVFVVYDDFCFGQVCQPVTVTVPAGGSVNVPSLPSPPSGVTTYKIIADPNSAITIEINRADNEACLGAFCSITTPTTCP